MTPGIPIPPIGDYDDCPEIHDRWLEAHREYEVSCSGDGVDPDWLHLRPPEALWQLVEDWRHELVSHPAALMAYRRLGRALCLLGRPKDAIEVLRTALALREALLDSPAEQGLALQAKNKYDEAAQYFRKAHAVVGDFAALYLELGRRLREQGDLAASTQAFAEVTNLLFTNAEARAALQELLKPDEQEATS